MRPSKRDELVRKALQVFYENGFHATGMDMLVRETGVSKTSMYKHFRTKEDLILAVLRLRDETFRNFLYRRMEELGDTPRDQLLALFDVLDEWFQMPDFHGCMFIKASGEFQDSAHSINAISREQKQLILAHLIDIARSAGSPDPEGLARQLVLLKEGAIVMAHMNVDETIVSAAKSAASSLIDF